MLHVDEIKDFHVKLNMQNKEYFSIEIINRFYVYFTKWMQH